MKQAKIMFYPNIAKKSKKNNLIPIFIRVSKNNTKTEARLDVSISPEDFEFWNPITQRSDAKGNSVNKRLEDITDNYEGLKYLYKETYMSFSAAVVKEKILNLDVDSATEIAALKYIDNHYNKVVLPNASLEKGTKRNYCNSINQFKKYLKQINKTSCRLCEINNSIARGFYDYLKQDIDSINKKGITPVSASSLVIQIKAIFGRAFDDEFIRKNPFKGIKLVKTSIKKPELDISEVKKLLNLDLSHEKKLEVSRDIFLFSVYTGFPFSDINKLSKEILVVNKSKYIMDLIRKKTEIPMKQMLVEYAVDLIKKYEHDCETEPLNRLFPKRNLQSYNKDLKILKNRAGIGKKVTSHIGRHTCSQFLTNLLISREVMNTMLGWSCEKFGSSMVYSTRSNIILEDAKTKYDIFLKEQLTTRIEEYNECGLLLEEQSK